MTPDTAEEPKDRWIRLLDRACRELTKVYRFRIVYTDVGKIIEENGTLPDSEIFALIQDGYAYMQALRSGDKSIGKTRASNPSGACCTR